MTQKKRINITISPTVVEEARKVIEASGKSLSAVVEEFLTSLINHDELSDDWLSRFHNKHIRKNFKEPTDHQIAKIRTGRVDQYK